VSLTAGPLNWCSRGLSKVNILKTFCQ